MHLNELKALHVSELLKQAEALEIDNASRMRKQELMFAIIKKRARAGEQVFADGPTASASCAARTPVTPPVPTTSTSRPARCGASTCTPAT